MVRMVAGIGPFSHRDSLPRITAPAVSSLSTTVALNDGAMKPA